jgi:hypothetical protein
LFSSPPDEPCPAELSPLERVPVGSTGDTADATALIARLTIPGLRGAAFRLAVFLEACLLAAFFVGFRAAVLRPDFLADVLADVFRDFLAAFFADFLVAFLAIEFLHGFLPHATDLERAGRTPSSHIHA